MVLVRHWNRLSIEVVNASILSVIGAFNKIIYFLTSPELVSGARWSLWVLSK